MSKKRQFGSVRRLRSGRWQARYRDTAGQMVTAPATFDAKADANRFLAAVETDMVRGQYVDPRAGRVTFTEFAEQWLARPGKRASSVATDRKAVAAFKESLGHLPLATITPGVMQAAVDARAKTVGPATIARDFSTLRAIFNAAGDAEVIWRSPARKVALPKVRPPDRVGLTPEELATLIDKLPDHYRALVLTAAVLGLRWSEVIALRVRDVDFLRSTVTVAQVVEEVAGHLTVIADAKSVSSLRTITAPAFLIGALAIHLGEHRADSKDDRDALVFVGPRGGVLRRRFGERILRPAVAAAKLPASLTFHGLRHVAISALADEDVHPTTMQHRAGHATTKLTLGLYSHVTDASDRAAADALEARFRPAFSAGSGTGVARQAPEGTTETA